MSRRNLAFLLIVSSISYVCYRKADGDYRSRTGRIFNTFTKVMKVIDKNYLERVDEKVLFENALTGMVGSLDEYSEYIPPVHFKNFEERIEQEYAGIGVGIFKRPGKGFPVITTIVVGSPAFEAGLLIGDKLMRINGDPSESWQLDEIASRLRGKEGDIVQLSLLRGDSSDPIEVTLKRSLVQSPSVMGYTQVPTGEWKYLIAPDKAIAYLRVDTFGRHTVQELQSVLEKLSGQGLSGLILDLRNNAGGLLESATGVCNLFVKSGRIVSTVGRDQIEHEVFQANGDARFSELPMVVLVNHQSASASEIVAACLQDHGRAVIVGERTWGKGTVQNVIPLDDGTSAIKLTTATYWRPSGTNIHRKKDATEQDVWGVVPNSDYQIKLTDEQLKKLIDGRDPTKPLDESQLLDLDPQLKKALEALETKLSKPIAA